MQIKDRKLPSTTPKKFIKGGQLDSWTVGQFQLCVCK